ncbi:protein hugin-like [Teleopsis dalmanni]|uniref:protein hugin-like n=1 Tax=Teleopsis dalmanni TaxID=139649 RepID=UPI0018CF5DB2|nr:protein hugin-like [Teleopsis dalmanni]
MSGLSCCTFLLMLLCYYSLSNCKAITNEHQATKKVDLPNHIENAPFTPEQQIRHTAVKTEARQKRSQRDLVEYKDLNDILEDLEDNSIAQAAAATTPTQDFDLDNMPPVTYYLLLQKLKQLQSNEPTYRVRTPRLGRSIDFQLMDGGANGNPEDEVGMSRQFVSRVIKKSVPFKPRLGKRTQMCDF